ncbi:MAG TPA: TonB-dependent receptor, partial [Saprospiraceae bacterium]|nr:TonB-dependent receptor [Saprospiraceae bacterium]
RLLQSESNDEYYVDSFLQTFIRPEFQASCYYLPRQKWTAGGGIAFEGVKTSRYEGDETRNQHTGYFFAQHEWTLGSHWEVVSGIRFDRNNVYGSQWSPKIAVQYAIGKKLKLKTSLGTGFKAPDFRYLYLNFRNGAAGYFVFGSNEVRAQIEQLSANGEILQFYYDVNAIGELDPEKSMAINAGFRYSFSENSHLDFNFFRNDLDGLIETQPIALTRDLKTIYSYSNIKKAYTQGVEAGFSHRFSFGLGATLSGQLLYAKDKEILDAIEDGLLFGRDPVTKESYRIGSRDYFGLYNRSRHTESLKVFYESPDRKWDASVRVIYKSKFGISSTAGSVQGNIRPSSDVNGNSVLDRFDRFVEGYAVCNLSVSRNFKDVLRIQLGSDNLFDYTDPVHIPALFGRNLYVNIHYKIYQK